MTKRRSHGTPITALCATALLAVVAGCEAPGPARGFVPRYEEPAAADHDSAGFLKQRRLVELVTADLNAYLDVPHRITVVARSCAGEGSGYDPGTRRIELCYDDLAEDRKLFEGAGRRPADEPLAEVVRETLHHEAGHALIDALDLPVRDQGRAEEDAADRFAQLMLLRTPEGDRTLLTAARAYDLAAAADPIPDPDDEHAPDQARAESHRCAAYGAAPARHPDLATPARAHCAATWTTTRDHWTADLTLLLR
ncbi:DUF4344 domain-containing metallopeptidase [Streptomyces avidinii]|uniref:Membrane protein n=1 Tax=Streptomyces avidinii TaxID=1895 RepID=A0ABS4LHY3_STRAV|nr:DUF4344 domain-containing metallopeptidase [Streptomyces avidinii]MBP2041720.1 putative membrane protein [Streptomyces avidinii]GGZ09804.1 hypothetical protein GCM10010343_39960 [Streptomyces avidinii]